MEEKRGKEFEKFAKPNAKGISGFVNLNNVPDNLKVTNGSNFTRKDSWLDKKYYVEKKYEKGSINTRTDDQKSGIGKGKLLGIKLDGFRNKETKSNKDKK